MSSILDKSAVRRAALPISVRQYHLLSEAGIIGQPTELLRGVIIERMTKSPLHTYLVQLLVKWLEAAITTDHHVRKEDPLTLRDSEPEPDVAVVRGTPQHYRVQHPRTADLVIEVAAGTAALDRDKADIYAEAGVLEYWIVIPNERLVEIHRQPSPAGYGIVERLSDPQASPCPRVLAPQAGVRLASLFDG